MPKHLLVVESPAKAKTIEKYLGSDFKVKSSFGHIRDLKKGNEGIYVPNFEPNYVVSDDKKRVVKDLKEWIKKVDEVWLATDEDREGEAISWHLCEVLGLDVTKTKRIVFREITKPAITSAIKTPRLVDIDLVNAQQARRVLDRLVGFDLSGLLWRKVRNKLSAGRVQSVAVKVLVDREREIQKFDASSSFKLQGIFNVSDGKGRIVKLNASSKEKLTTSKQVQTFLNECKQSSYKINDIEVKAGQKKPSAPFTTSTLQQEASRKLGFSVKRTMMTAQRLYESGLITYMRTDSVSLSQTALNALAAEIEKQYGKNYVHTHQYTNKKSNAQEAHEAIRPTYVDRKAMIGDRDQERLYDLIWKRTIASQMSNAQIERTLVKIDISNKPAVDLVAEGQVLKFDGFLKVYLESKDDEEDEETKGMLPPLKVGQNLNLNKLMATQKFTKSAPRYTEAGLVKRLEELGIGRPSTYAPTISRIMEEARGYVVKGSSDGKSREIEVISLDNSDNVNIETKTETTGAYKNRLVPTDLGMLVTDFLTKHFEQVMQYDFTAKIEEDFDDIAGGKVEWKAMLKDFYDPFHDLIEKTMKEAERATGERILGKDPESGRTILTRMSRGGAVVQIGAQDELGEDEKPRYANLKPGQSIENISYEEALKLFLLPKTLGEFNAKEVIVARGRYGPYVKYDDLYVSIPKDEDPMELSLQRAEELIKEKLKELAPVASYQNIPVTQGKGRFGPYLKWNNMFINIPRKYDPDNLSKDDMFELIAAKIEKEANRYVSNWPEEDISIQNGRWGPFIKFKKKNVKLPKIDDKRQTAEQAKELTLEDVKKLILEEIPDAFKTKKKATRKKK